MAYLKSVEESNKKKEINKSNCRIKFANKKNWIHKNVYNTYRWRKLRLNYLAEHPLCECCLRKGIKKLAEHVHHRNEISSGNSNEQMIQLAFDINNLEALCRECHVNEHNGNKQINYFLFDDKNNTKTENK